MAIRITTWTSDTCGCVNDYSWDDTTTEDNRVHTYVATVQTCSNHSTLSTPTTLKLNKAQEIDRVKKVYEDVIAAAKQRRLDSFLDTRPHLKKLGRNALLSDPSVQEHIITTNRDLAEFKRSRFDAIDTSPLAVINPNVYNSVILENARKNQFYQQAIDALPTDLGQTDPASGTLILKNNITFNFSWTGTPPNRVLVISYSGVTISNAKKNALQNAVNTRFGTGKVLIQ